MKRFLFLLALPFLYLLTTAESCNCELDPNELSAVKEQLTGFEKSKAIKVVYRSSEQKAAIDIAKDCSCLFSGDSLETVSSRTFGIENNQSDPLQLSPLGPSGGPSLDPRVPTVSNLSAFLGCISCTGGVTGGGRIPPPPVPPVGDEELGFDKFTTLLVGPDPKLGGKSDFTELNLISKTALGRPDFFDLAPQDAWKGTIAGKDAFSTSRNGYVVAVIDLGDAGVLRVGSFSGERVQYVLEKLTIE
ncbi:MAG: hypothetical protein K1X92_03385 [Bacteroidia bacterium]|nr:hypothetical protein [Bacteroidia bacterium]